LGGGGKIRGWGPRHKIQTQIASDKGALIPGLAKTQFFLKKKPAGRFFQGFCTEVLKVF